MHSHSGPVKQIIQSQCIVIKLPPDSTTEPTRRDLTLNYLSSPFDPQRGDRSRNSKWREGIETCGERERRHLERGRRRDGAERVK